ncbi:TauD/TfdA family dioxygenase [Aquabacterium sp.]|uniref:TauD/TfdA family dioxygenase n=1 Tax=Aquabacterium sp. TaxID=1872578 RepID=UPI002C880AB7|nr:TauD/TfdA family dioxygenase [Aquabacterium sp.]HSW08092.1 TauD/TfdA family dioxygenase [Aquabacterium sp.]
MFAFRPPSAQSAPVGEPPPWLRAFEETGLVLLSGAELDLTAFEAVTQQLCGQFHHVATRQALRQQQGDGYTTEVFRDNFILFAHAEGSYRPYPPPPQVCFFLCVTPPTAAGGETTVIDGAAVYQHLPAPLRERLAQQGVVYECLWAPERWQAEFGVATTAELQALMVRLPGVRWDIDAQATLQLWYHSAALSTCRTGQPVFATGLLAHLPQVRHPRYDGLPAYSKPTNRVYFGDGEPIGDGDVNTLIDLCDALAYAHRWQAGELLMLDNTRYMHGRNMTAEPCPRVLVSRFGHYAPTAAAGVA